MSRDSISVAEYHAARAAEMGERDELMPQVIEIAQQLGWLVYHTHRSQHSEAGFPDLLMLRGNRQVVAELKREQTARRRIDREPTSEQRLWLEAFARIEHCESYLWRPSDLLSGRIHEVLA